MKNGLLSLVIVPILVRFLLNMIFNEKKNDGSVHAPKSVYVLALVFGSLAALVLLSQFYFHGNNNVWAIGGGLGLLSLLFAVIGSSLWIRYDEKTFTVQRFFFTRSFKYTQIQSITHGASGSFVLRVAGKRVFVDAIMVGAIDFLLKAEMGFCEEYGEEIPELPPRLFRGNLLNPGEFLFILLLLPVFATTGLGYSVYSALTVRIPEDLTPYPFSAAEYTLDGDYLTIAVADGELLMDMTLADNTEDLKKDLESDRELQAMIDGWHTNKKHSQTTIWALKNAYGREYLSEQRVLEQCRESAKIYVRVLGGIVLFAWIATAAVIHILNNAPKHPKLMAILVKKEYWNF